MHGTLATINVQGRPILGVVDRMAAEHELYPARHFGLFGQHEQRLERARIERLPAEVEQDPFRFERATVEALRVQREEILDRDLLERLRAL